MKNSEVVITGTVTKIVSESSHGEEKDEFDVEPIREITPPNPIGHQTVGFVQLWRVVKGTIEHVTNYSYSTNGTQILLFSITFHSPNFSRPRTSRASDYTSMILLSPTFIIIFFRVKMDRPPVLAIACRHAVAYVGRRRKLLLKFI